jgi:hypothetical protein
VVAVQMGRLSHISVTHHIPPIKERHHRRNPFDLTPSAHPEALNSSARHTGHPIGASWLLRQGCAHRGSALTSGERREFTARKCRQWRVRASKPYAQRESITYRR